MKDIDKVEKNRTIVIVEDNDNVATLISKSLSNAGFKTKSVSFGSAAVFYVLENSHSLLLMDYFLPDMTAKEVIQSLHANKKQVPFIIMSNPGNEKTIVDMMKMGARDFLMKEKGFIELLPSAINKVLEQMSVENKLQSVEKSLRFSRDKFKHIFDSIADAVYIYDVIGKLIEANEAAASRLGFNRKSIETGSEDISFINFQDHQFRQRYKLFLNDLQSMGQLRFKTTEIDIEGNEIPVECVARMIECDGKDAVLTISRDITEQNKMQELLENSEQRFHLITNTISDYIFTVHVKNKQPVKTVHSPACERVTGYSSEELKGRPFLWLDMVYKEDKDFVLENVKKVINGERVNPFEHRITKKDGSIVWLRNTPVQHYDQANNLVSYDGVVQDITAQKTSEQNLLEKQAHLNSIIKAFEGLIYVCTSDNRIIFANEKMIERTGHDPTGELCYKALHDLDKVCPWCVNDQVQKGETVRWEALSPKDNRWYSVVDVPIHHHDGKVSKQSLIMDVTEKKYADNELSRLNNLYYGLTDLISTPVCRFNSDGSIISANKAFYNLFKKKQSKKNNEDEVTDLPIFDYLTPTLRQWTKDGLEMLSEEKSVIKKKFKIKDSNTDKDNIWVIKAIVNQEKEIVEYQGIVTDFTVELDGKEKTITMKSD